MNYTIPRVPKYLSLRPNWLTTPTLRLASMSPPLGTKGRGGGRQRLPAGEGAGGANSDDWRESLALCLLYSVHCVGGGMIQNQTKQKSLVFFTVCVPWTEQLISGLGFFKQIPEVPYSLLHLHPSDSTVSKDAGIKPDIVATFALERRKDLTTRARSHPHPIRSNSLSARSHLIHTSLSRTQNCKSLRSLGIDSKRFILQAK